MRLRVAFDGKESFKSLPDGMLTDPDDSSIAIYDSFEWTSGPSQGLIARERRTAQPELRATCDLRKQYFQISGRRPSLRRPFSTAPAAIDFPLSQDRL